MNSEHDRHDRVLVARFAAGDAYPSERAEAERLVEGCTECSALVTDISLIAARTADLPQVSRPRDFRINPEQADKLRGSWFDRLMRGFATPGWAAARPLAGAALAIGLALVVVGALPINGLNGGSLPEVAPPNFSSLDSGNPSARAVTGNNPQAPIASVGQLDVATSTGAPPLAASTTSPAKEGVGSAEGTFPSLDVDNSLGTPASLSTPATPVAATSEAPPPETSQTVSPAPPSPGQAYVGPPVAQPSAAPEHVVVLGQANAGVVSSSSLDKPVLVVGGMLLAFLALMALGLIWVARRRYSDPLVR